MRLAALAVRHPQLGAGARAFSAAESPMHQAVEQQALMHTGQVAPSADQTQQGWALPEGPVLHEALQDQAACQGPGLGLQSPSLLPAMPAIAGACWQLLGCVCCVPCEPSGARA